jgi:hypothetical protein
LVQFDAPLSSLNDSNASLKFQTSKVKKVGVRYLVHNILGVRGAHWSFEMGNKMNDKQINYSHGPTQTKQQVD